MVRCYLKEYHTGWDRGLCETATGIKIEAHAPSSIRLQVIRGGTVRIRGSLHREGNDLSSYSISLNSFAINVLRDQQVTIDVREGDLIGLSIGTEFKDRCWTFWIIDNLCIIPPDDIVLGTHRPLHLGDAIGLLIGLENFNRLNRTEISVVPLDLFCSLINCLDLPTIRVVDRAPTLLVEDFFWKLPWTGFWPSRVVKGLTEIVGGISGDCQMPTCKIDVPTVQEDFVACQFDSRSAAPLSEYELRRALDFLAGDSRVVVVGGPDTKRYLGDAFEYRLGGPEEIIRNLLACRRFIGVDSGLAHVAGVLDVPSYIVNLIDYPVVLSFFGGYKNTVVVDRRLLCDTVI